MYSNLYKATSVPGLHVTIAAKKWWGSPFSAWLWEGPPIYAFPASSPQRLGTWPRVLLLASELWSCSSHQHKRCWLGSHRGVALGSTSTPLHLHPLPVPDVWIYWQLLHTCLCTVSRSLQSSAAAPAAHCHCCHPCMYVGDNSSPYWASVCSPNAVGESFREPASWVPPSGRYYLLLHYVPWF